jgi:uncharacterized protein YndB with AHSA1/START domain
MTASSKILLWILLITTIVGAGLWLAGGKKQECSAEIEIVAPPNIVFEFLVEPRKLKSWMTNITEVAKLVPAEKTEFGPTRVVTTRIVNLDGKQTTYEDEVIRFQENEFLSVQSIDANHVITSIFSLQPESEGTTTRLSYRITVAHQGLGRLLAPIRSNSQFSQRQLNADIRVLKEKVESRN